MRADEAKGRVKEAAGVLADDDDLKAEGRADRATGAVKEAVDEGAEKLKLGAERVKEVLSRRRTD